MGRQPTNFTLSTQVAPLLLLPPGARLRYVLDDRSKRVMTIADARAYAGLIFTAWDATKFNKSLGYSFN